MGSVNPEPRWLVFVERMPTPFGWVDIAIEVAPNDWRDFEVTDLLLGQINASLPKAMHIMERACASPRFGWIRGLDIGAKELVTLRFWPSEDGSNVPVGTIH